MNLPLFLARRIYNGEADHRKVSRPAIRIATIGVAVGLAVMIVTVSVVLGFKHTIRDKVVGFGAHIQVQNIMSLSTGTDYPICVDDSMLSVLSSIEGINHAERYANTQGILKTDDDFLGISLKGVGPEYDATFLNSCLMEGSLPQFCDTATTYPLVISQTISRKLGLSLGQKVFAYFIDEGGIRARRFTVEAIYQTNMKRFDDVVCLTDLYATRKLNGWFEDQCSGAELSIGNFDQLEDIYLNVVAQVNRTLDRYKNTFSSRTILEAYPQVFSWLQLLDLNVWIILGLMVALAGITMVSGLLIIILERTQMIGLLKALGARNQTVRKTFLWFAAFIIGRGLLWGNLLGIGLVLLQKYTGMVTLDPQTYYVSEAPVELNIPLIVVLNLATLLLCIFILVGPSYLASRVSPAQSIRYE